MKQWSIGPGPAATLIVTGDPDNPVPVLIQNVDPANTAYLGETPATNPNNPLEGVPLLPGQSSIATGDINVFCIAASGQNVSINTLRGFGSFFQPTNLTNLGGVAIYNTLTPPTQPPTIPANSLWFSPNGAINQWNGSSWVPISFNGAEIITASTITASELAAGIVYAGIVNGTTLSGTVINGSIFNGANWTSDTNGTRFYSGTPARNNLIASIGGSQYTDPFGNIVLRGVSAYNPSAGGFALFVQMDNGGINIGVSTGADETTGWTQQVSGLGADASGVLQYANAIDGNTYLAGISTVRMATNQPLTSTSPTLITSMVFNVVAGLVYRIFFMAVINSDTATAGGVTFSFGGTSVIGNVNGRFTAYQAGANPTSTGIIDGVLVSFNSFSPAAAGTRQVIEVEMWATVGTGGTLRFNAALTAAAATYHVRSCIGRMEPIL